MLGQKIAQRLSVPVACVLLCLLGSVARGEDAATCSPDSVGIGAALATTSGDIILGKAWGETFTATDTLIRYVAVWRIPSEAANPSALKFWITEADSTGYPHTQLVVYEGPTTSFVSSDTTKPTRIQYDFDPPISLPRPSQYCFWVQEVCTGYADLLIDPNNHYSGGHLWQTYRSDFDGCVLRPGPRSLVTYDLAFQIGFCKVDTTPTLEHTWGELKVLYR